MKRARRIAIVIGILGVGLGWFYQSRPVLYVTEDAPLWGSEYDASRQGTELPGPGIPLGDLLADSRLVVLRTTYGKDYRARYVVGPGWCRGWILTGQRGIEMDALYAAQPRTRRSTE